MAVRPRPRGYGGRVTRVLAILLLVLAIVPTWSGDERLPLWSADPDVRARYLPRIAPGNRVGALTYLGGVALASHDPAFGGFSGLVTDGRRFTLLSDGGLFYSFDLRRWQPVRERFGALPGGPDTGWRKAERDSESIARDPATGALWVGFERYNAIYRYTDGFAATQRMAAPPVMRRWPVNGGPEAMARLDDGRFLVFSEADEAPGGGTSALIFAGDPTDPAARPARFAWVAPAGYEVTDATQLPDGRIAVLQRRLSVPRGWTAVISLVDLAAIRPGARVRGREIARFTNSVVRDNYEGLAATREGAATILWLVSDDNNGTLFQRNLLLKFRLEA